MILTARGKINYWGPTRFILAPIIFNIFFSDLFLIVTESEFASYEEDNPKYKSHETAGLLISLLQNIAKKLFKWFSNSQMNDSTDKCHLLISSHEKYKIQIEDPIIKKVIKKSDCEKLLGVKIDSKQSFNEHIRDFCKNATKKVSVGPNHVSHESLKNKTFKELFL